MYTYSAYHLIISSELPLPELGLFDNLIGKEQANISIIFGHARRECVPNASIQGLYYHIEPDACWFEIPNITYFLIKDGCQIIIEPFPGIDEDSLRLFLYTTCLPIVLIYHNFFLFHGAAIHGGAHGVAFLANYGQGKSTLLASFLKHHYFFLSDDICVLNQEGFIMPGIPYLQLREDVIKSLNIDQTTLKMIRPMAKKWFVPVGQSFYSQPSLLKNVYIINPTNRPDLLLTPLVGLRKIQYLKKYTYNPLFVKGLGKDLFYFQQCALLAARTTATYVERAKQDHQWHEFATIIAHDLESRGLECQ
jgi:hypothetical protein